MLENAVAVWLKQHYGEEVYYIRSAATGIDIDFFIPSEHAAVQVCLDLNDQSADREVSSLAKASSMMPDLKRLIIITSEGSSSGLAGHPEIELIPVDVFLLKGLSVPDTP